MKVLLAASEGEAYFDLLNDLDGLEIIRCKPADVPQHIGDVEVFFGFPSAEVLTAAPKLRWIQSPSAGVEYVARIPELRESDILLTNSRGAHGPSIGEHVFALLLAFTRGLPLCFEWQRNKYWGRNEGYRSLKELRDTTMGIVGYGAIGRGVAQRAQGFEMKLLAVDAHPVDGKPYIDEVWPVERLHEMLGQSDSVVIATPFTPQTEGLFDAETIAAMKPGTYLIVVSRGGIVDEDALAQALHSGKLAGAALDVTAIEPLPQESPLWEAPNCIITPHLAGASGPKERRVVEIFKNNLVRYMKGDDLVNLVDKRLGY